MPAPTPERQSHPLHRGDGIPIGYRPDYPEQGVYLTQTAVDANTLVTGQPNSVAPRILARTLHYRAEHYLPTIGVDPAGSIRKALPESADDIIIIDLNRLSNPFAPNSMAPHSQVTEMLEDCSPVFSGRLRQLLTAIAQDVRHHNRRHPERQLSPADFVNISLPLPDAEHPSLLCDIHPVDTAAPAYWQHAAVWPPEVKRDLLCQVHQIGQRFPQRPFGDRWLAERIRQGQSVLFTAQTGLTEQPQSGTFNTLCDAVFRAVLAELEQRPTDLLVISDRYRSATETDWSALTDPAARSPLRLMLSDPIPEVADDIWPPRPGPGPANCGTLVLGAATEGDVEKLAAAYPIADSVERLRALSPDEGFLLTCAYGDPTGAFFTNRTRHYRTEPASPA